MNVTSLRPSRSSVTLLRPGGRGDGAGPRRRGARVRGGQDDGGDRAHGRAAPPRHRGGAVQGRSGLHRPRLPHARRGPPRPQPRPGARRRRPDRPAGPPRRGRSAGRRRRGRDGALRRSAWPTATARPPRSPGCSGRRSCSSSTSAASPAASPRCCTASGRSTPGCDLAGVVLNRVGSPRHEEVLQGRGRRGRAAGPRRPSPPRRAGRAVAPPRAGDGGRARRRGRRGRRRHGRAGRRPRRPRCGDGARPPAAVRPSLVTGRGRESEKGARTPSSAHDRWWGCSAGRRSRSATPSTSSC